MDPETVLYLILAVVIVTLVAFCYACYCTCKELKINSSSPTSSTAGRGYFSGNPVVTVVPARTWTRQKTQIFRQLSWRTFMQRNRSPTLSSCSSGSSYPLIARRRASLDPGQLSPNLIAVIYDGSGSNRNLSGSPVSPSTLAPPSHLTLNMPQNCAYFSNLHDTQHPHRDMPVDDLPTYDAAIRLSIVPDNTNTNKSTTNQ